jgi:hypothetical protein
MGTLAHLHWEDYEPDFEQVEDERPRDAMVDTAKEALRQFFDNELGQVFLQTTNASHF